MESQQLWGSATNRNSTSPVAQGQAGAGLVNLSNQSHISLSALRILPGSEQGK
jgi:hypothetical protein